MQRHRGAKKPGHQAGGRQFAEEAPPAIPCKLLDCQGTSDHRDAPTSQRPREETEGALYLRTCLTASPAHFRSAEARAIPVRLQCRD